MKANQAVHTSNTSNSEEHPMQTTMNAKPNNTSDTSVQTAALRPFGTHPAKYEANPPRAVKKIKTAGDTPRFLPGDNRNLGLLLGGQTNQPVTFRTTVPYSQILVTAYPVVDDPGVPVLDGSTSGTELTKLLDYAEAHGAFLNQ